MATGLDRSRWRAVCVLPFEGPLADDLRAGGVEVVIRALPVLRRADPVDLLRRWPRMRADIVHANTSVILGRADVVHVREIYPRWPVLWALQRRRIERARVVVAVSAAVGRQFSGAQVIHDGLAVAPERAPGGRAALGLPADGTMVAVLGRISSWKGQDQLIRALPLTRDAHALLAGAPWPGQEHHERALRELAADLGVSDRVHFAGFRDDIENVLGAADVVAVPSTRPDPFPNSALEAAAAGCCVVAVDAGGLPEMLRHDETGWLYDGTPEALAHAIDTADRDRLGAAARTDVRERFAPERMLERIDRLYTDLMSQRCLAP
jgi:glycosyltransferase involved in cell wall biosynthesis